MTATLQPTNNKSYNFSMKSRKFVFLFVLHQEQGILSIALNWKMIVPPLGQSCGPNKINSGSRVQ